LGTAVIVLVVAGLLPTMDVASSASMMFLLLFFLVNICVIKVRRNMGDELNYGYLMPFFPILPILAIMIQATLAIWMHQMSLIAWVIAPGWILTGVFIYFFYAKSKSVTTSYEIVTLEEEKAEEEARYRVLIPVANPNNALQLVRNGFKILEAKQAQVELLTMVKVPEQLPLSHAEDYMWEGREAITEAMIYLTTYFPVTTTIRYCRNVARGIVSAAREKKIDTIILGWKGRTARTDYIFGSTIDPVIQNAPSNVLVFKNCDEKTYKRIVVPVSGGPNSRLAVEVASIMATPNDGYVVPLNITAPGKETLDIEQFLKKNFDQSVQDKVREPRYIVSRQVSSSILEVAKDFDLIVLGASNAKALSHLIRSTIPEDIAAGTDKPMVMVKSTEGFKSLLKRYI
jgi:nucleotide-binding universal stress UspA family protein